MLKLTMRATAILILLLTGTSICLAAEKNMFKDLPGVIPPKGLSTQSDERPDCTSQIVSPYYHGRRQLRSGCIPARTGW